MIMPNPKMFDSSPKVFLFFLSITKGKKPEIIWSKVVKNKLPEFFCF